jgi:rhodanese-related sulfurtransferase
MIRLWKVPAIIFFVLVIIFSSCGCFRREVEEVVAGVEREDKPLYQDIPVDEAKRLIDINDNVFIIDVRTQQEYDEGHILGSKLIPIDEFEKAVSEGKIPPGKTVLIYCRSESRSSKAADMLGKTGYNNVKGQSVNNMLGGFDEWRSKGYPVEY